MRLRYDKYAVCSNFLVLISFFKWRLYSSILFTIVSQRPNSFSIPRPKKSDSLVSKVLMEKYILDYSKVMYKIEFVIYKTYCKTTL